MSDRFPNLFAFDTETTGLVPGKDEIISFAYEILAFDLSVISKGCIYAHPSSPAVMSPQAQAINGYTWEKWEARGAISQKVLSWRITEVWAAAKLSKTCPLGHNVAFDLNMLTGLVGKDLIDKYLGYHKEDTVAIARFLDRVRGVQNSSYKLTSCCERFGVTLTDAHDAASDIAATVELYRKLVIIARGDAPLPEGKTDPFLVKEGADGAYVFSRGKHKGFQPSAVPRGYLQWALDNTKLGEEEIAVMLKARDAK